MQTVVKCKNISQTLIIHKIILTLDLKLASKVKTFVTFSIYFHAKEQLLIPVTNINAK